MIRWLVRIAFGAMVVLVLYVAVTFGQVWWAARSDDSAASSAIVVMGAAQWNGRPSPVLKGRLDHATELYEAGVAPLIVVTGGKQAGDATTQGRSGYDYLREQGIPDEAIKVEVQGTNSFEELSASSVILHDAQVGHDVVIVTDPYHALRVSEIAEEVGLRPHVSPTDSSTGPREMARETVAVAVGRLVGYRRLSTFT